MSGAASQTLLFLKKDFYLEKKRWKSPRDLDVDDEGNRNGAEWVVLIDKRYQVILDSVRAVHPKKPRNHVLTPADKCEEKETSRDRVIVETFSDENRISGKSFQLYLHGTKAVMTSFNLIVLHPQILIYIFFFLTRAMVTHIKTTKNKFLHWVFRAVGSSPSRTNFLSAKRQRLSAVLVPQDDSETITSEHGNAASRSQLVFSQILRRSTKLKGASVFLRKIELYLLYKSVYLGGKERWWPARPYLETH